MKIVSKNNKSDILSDPAFLKSYYGELEKTTKKAFKDQSKWLKLASTYISDGMDETECAELLAIDGLPRDVSEKYAQMVSQNGNLEKDTYSFEFENVYGDIISSSEVKRFVQASTEEEAWSQAQTLIENEMQDLEPDHIVSVKIT